MYKQIEIERNMSMNKSLCFIKFAFQGKRTKAGDDLKRFEYGKKKENAEKRKSCKKGVEEEDKDGSGGSDQQGHVPSADKEQIVRGRACEAA